MLTLREKLSQYGFQTKAPIRVSYDGCPSCDHGKPEDALDLPLTATSALYGYNCDLLRRGVTDSLEIVLRFVRVLEGIERGLAQNDEWAIARADALLPFKSFGTIIEHESRQNIRFVMDKIINEKLSLLVTPKTGKHYAATPYHISWTLSNIRISRLRWGFGEENIIILGPDEVELVTVVDGTGTYEKLRATGKPGTADALRIEELNPEDTQEVLETANVLAVTMTLKEALEAARNLK